MSVIDLGRARAALTVLDRLAGSVRPVGLNDLDAMTQEASVKVTSVRLTAAQEAELERLAAELQRLRPDLAALARGGELSPYTVLRLAIDRGLRALADDVDPARRGAPALRVRRSDGSTVAADELAATVAHLADLLDAVDKAAPDAVEGALWALAADARDLVAHAEALGVVER